MLECVCTGIICRYVGWVPCCAGWCLVLGGVAAGVSVCCKVLSPKWHSCIVIIIVVGEQYFLSSLVMGMICAGPWQDTAHPMHRELVLQRDLGLPQDTSQRCPRHQGGLWWGGPNMVCSYSYTRADRVCCLFYLLWCHNIIMYIV